MPVDRRNFLKAAACTSIVFTAQSVFGTRFFKIFAAAPLSQKRYDAYPANLHIVYDDDKEYMAFSTATPFTPYQSKKGPQNAVTWMQIDLGKKQPIDKIKLYPAVANGWGFWTDKFPKRFKIEVSDDSDLRKSSVITDQTDADYNPGLLRICEFTCNTNGRYLRLTVTSWSGDTVRLSKIGVFSGEKDLAVNCLVSVDTDYGNTDGPAKAAQLTRPHRPMGEGIVTDNKANVSNPGSWRPPTREVTIPATGIVLAGGLFQKAMQQNIRYLLQIDTVDHHLRPFRERAGKPVVPDPKEQIAHWETYLPCSSAGRFLMGAGNTLRWMEHPELRTRMNALVDGIEECKTIDGYILAYDPSSAFDCERGAYDRAWLTHGLIEAGYAGNNKAFGLLRQQYDWFNKWTFLPKLLRGAGQGGQGLIASTRLYFTPVGKPEDIQTIQRYFQENFWMTALANEDPDAIWLYPYDRPHCYLLTNLEAYMDLYLSTGNPQYLEAVKGGWNLYHDHWEHVGGSIAICEFKDYAPDSLYLHARTGEFCGSVFWIRLNQRFHQLFPNEEKYVAEIEKSIYNVGLANQVGDEGIIYITKLVDTKEKGQHSNTCCEGQGTRLYGSLPEYIYSLAPDGVYINLFEASVITWKQHGRELQLQMQTQFPANPDVRIKFSGGNNIQAKICIRIPSWATGEMEIKANDDSIFTGKPGSYVTISKNWSDGDEIAFTLPVGFKMTRYRGKDAPDKKLYALEYGPLLMAASGTKTASIKLASGKSLYNLLTDITVTNKTLLHFTLGDEAIEYVPYWQIGQGESFTCFTAINA